MALLIIVTQGHDIKDLEKEKKVEIVLTKAFSTLH